MDVIKTTDLIKLIIYYILMFGPRMCSSSTKVYLIENDKVCSPDKTRHIHLGKYNSSAAILRESRYFDTWYGDHDFKCKISVEISLPGIQGFPIKPPGGIFAVIQNISLRKDWHTGECIDYIQFKHNDGEKSEEYCGEFASADTVLGGYDSSNISQYAFIEKKGRMEIVIYIGKQRLRRGERIDFTIALTAYKECKPYDDADVYATCIQKEAEIYKQMHNNNDHMKKHHYCIWKNLFNDTILNCPYTGCYEEGCLVSRVVSHHGNGTAITVGSLATVILVFFVFICSLWICRKCQVLFWKPRTTQQPISMQFAEDAVSATEVVTASAPSISNATEPNTPDKDPPPSYDSLFPPKPSDS